MVENVPKIYEMRPTMKKTIKYKSRFISSSF